MKTEKYDLQEVLDSVMLEESKPSHAALLRWIKRYPKFSKQLENFFVSWSESEMWKHLPDPVEIDDKDLTERAVKRVLDKRRSGERNPL